MNGLREICHCGNAKTSHYFDPATGTWGACLCTGCGCTGYANEFDPPPKKRLVRPDHALWCKCARCKEYDAQQVPDAPSTLTMLDNDPPDYDP